MSIGMFLFAGALFGAFLYHQATGLEILTSGQAEMARGITMLSIWVILVVEAFSEDMMQGVLSIFLPPYAFVYGVFFADAGPIRGLTLALLVFLGGEMYFTPNNALVPKITNGVMAWVESTQEKLIQEDTRPDAGF